MSKENQGAEKGPDNEKVNGPADPAADQQPQAAPVQEVPKTGFETSNSTGAKVV